MSERSIILYPNPMLRRKADPVVTCTAGDLIRDLWDTLDGHVGVGLAAPQIGFSLRAVVIDLARARRPVPNHGRLCLLNPQLLTSEGQIGFREGCMSIPDLVAHVPRAERITVAAILPDGNPVTFTCEGFEAVVIQHEMDHLDGVLFIDRVNSARDIKPRVR